MSLPFHIHQLMKSLPSHMHEAWQRYLFRAEPPRIGPYREQVPLGSDNLGIPGAESLRSRRRPLLLLLFFFSYVHAARPRDFFLRPKNLLWPNICLSFLFLFWSIRTHALLLRFGFQASRSRDLLIKNMNISFADILFTLIRCSFIESFFFPGKRGKNSLKVIFLVWKLDILFL